MIRQLFFGISIAFSIGLLQWITKGPQFSINPNGNSRLEKIKGIYDNGLLQLHHAIQIYEDRAAAFELGKSDSKSLQQAHLNTRLAFKKVEFLLEYYDREAVDFYLNGAPLPSLEQNIAENNVIEPEGLQVLDELVFAEDPHVEKDEILRLVNLLAENFNRIQDYQKRIRIYDRHIFEAARFELIRIFSLGLTGFDTPGSVNAIPEARVAMASLHEVLRIYTNIIDPEMGEQFSDLFVHADQYLQKHQDFDTFDRLYFLRQFINPLYGQIYEIQRLIGVEMVHETAKTQQSVNYNARNIFAEDFLNPYYFAKSHPDNISDLRAEIGRLLFFDPVLSANNKRACASCHQPDKAFTDGLQKSLAFDFQGEIQRNAPTVINSVLSERFFYDLRLENISRQMEHVVFNGMEFNTDFQTIIKKLNGSEEYRKLFEEAYPEALERSSSGAIAQWTITNSITAYLIQLIALDSPFDRYVRGESFELNESAQNGFNLFMGKAACGTCHFAPTFNGLVPPIYHESESEVLGVPVKHDTLNPQLDSDIGRYGSQRPDDRVDFKKHAFKTVTVRNAALTAPYMHNGAYETLEEVMDFYNRGGGAGMGLEVPYQTLPDTPLNLTKKEQSDLIAFIGSLTDVEGLPGAPKKLPKIDEMPELNNRKIGGEY